MTSKDCFDQIFNALLQEADAPADYDDLLQKVRALLAQHDGTPPPGADIPSRIVQILGQVALIAHAGGLIGFEEQDKALNEIRRLTRSFVGTQVDELQARAQPLGGIPAINPPEGLSG